MSPSTPTAGVAGAPVGGPEHAIGTGESVILPDLAQLSIGDEKAVEIKTEASGSYSGKARAGNSYSPSTQRYTPPFVRNGRSKSEDPFQATPKSAPHATPTKSSRIKGPWRSGSSSSSGCSAPDSPSPLNAQSQRTQPSSSARDHANGSPPHVTGYSLVRAEDAQAIYPPSCCVFVANLLQSESEDVLQMEVTQIFREFGPVFVKIRRDTKQMPFAFCQYTKPEHADRAIREGRGRLIRGRPCRCEKAKAHLYVVDRSDRSTGLFFIERKFGDVLTPVEADKILSVFGKIELCYTASPVERTALNLNEGVIVQFEMYDEGQNAHSALRHSEHYKIQPINGIASPLRNNQVRSPAASDAAARAYIARYEVDRRSIFIGNLPAGTTDDQLRGLFEHYGHVVGIVVRETISKFDIQERLAFAFIEFESAIAVGNAISAKNGFCFGGRAMRVAQKDSETTTAVRRPRANVSAAAYQSPAPRRAEPQVSPVAQMSPPLYSSPYGYPYSPYYSYAPPTFVTDGQGYYPTAPYSPAYYSYGSSPSYDPRATAHTEVAAPSNVHPGYYGYSPYQYPTAPYCGTSNTEQHATSAPANYYPPLYSPPMESSTGPDDRSATPTPAGHTAVSEAPAVESE